MAMNGVRRVRLYENNSKPFMAQKIDRNAPCPCGSGKKAKKSCGTETKYFVKK